MKPQSQAQLLVRLFLLSLLTQAIKNGAARSINHDFSSSSDSTSSSEEIGGAAAVNEKSHLKFPDLQFHQRDKGGVEDGSSEENSENSPSELSDGSFGGGTKSDRSVESEPSTDHGNSDQDKAVRAVSSGRGKAFAGFPSHTFLLASSSTSLSKMANQKQETRPQSNVFGPHGGPNTLHGSSFNGTLRVTLSNRFNQPIMPGSGAQFTVKPSGSAATSPRDTRIPFKGIQGEGTPYGQSLSVSNLFEEKQLNHTDTTENVFISKPQSSSMFGRTLFPGTDPQTTSNFTERLATAPPTSARNLDFNSDMTLETGAKLPLESIAIPTEAQLPPAPIVIEPFAELSPSQIAIEPHAELRLTPIAIEPSAEPPPTELAIEPSAEPPPTELTIEPSAGRPPNELAIEPSAEPSLQPIAIESPTELLQKPIIVESPAGKQAKLAINSTAVNFHPFEILAIPEALQSKPVIGAASEAKVPQTWRSNEAITGIAKSPATIAAVAQHGPEFEMFLKELLKALRHALTATRQDTVLQPKGRSSQASATKPQNVHGPGVIIHVNTNEGSDGGLHTNRQVRIFDLVVNPTQKVPATKKLSSAIQSLADAIQQRQPSTACSKLAVKSEKSARNVTDVPLPSSEDPVLPVVVIRMEPIHSANITSLHSSSTELAANEESTSTQYPMMQRVVIRIRMPNADFALELHANSHSSLWTDVQQMLQALQHQSSQTAHKPLTSSLTTATSEPAAPSTKHHNLTELFSFTRTGSNADSRDRPKPQKEVTKSHPEVWKKGRTPKAKSFNSKNSHPATAKSFITSHGLGLNGAMVLVPLTERSVALLANNVRSKIVNLHESFVFKERFGALEKLMTRHMKDLLGPLRARFDHETKPYLKID